MGAGPPAASEPPNPAEAHGKPDPPPANPDWPRVVRVTPADGKRTSTDMAGYIKQGRYLKDGEKGIVMGRKIAARLDVRLGEKVVLMAQAADGSMGETCE